MKENKVIKLGVLFYIVSILGYLYELILSLIFNGKLLSHGILYGPWLPIYGTGSLLIINLKKYKNNPLKVFILSCVITGLLEYICGYLLLKFLNKRLWDYRGWFLNLNGFVSFLSLFCFGIGSLLIIYFIYPKIETLFKKVNHKVIKLGLSVISILFFGDTLITILKYLLK